MKIELSSQGVDMSYRRRENIEKNANILSQHHFSKEHEIKLVKNSSKSLNYIPNKIKKSKMVGSYHLHFHNYKVYPSSDLDYFENRLI